MFLEIMLAVLWIAGLTLGLTILIKRVYSTIIKNKKYVPYTDNKTKSVNTLMTMPNKKQYKKKIEAVIICVNYSDFLRWTLPFNKQHFDKTVVVTTKDDIETQEICSFWNVQCEVTDCFYDNGDVFNKANGINHGLKFLGKEDWVVHMDADIFLPPKTRQILDTLKLHGDCLYTIDRLNCPTFTEWIMFLEHPENQHPNNGLLVQSAFQKGARLINLDRDGYVPLGFFQLWNVPGSQVYKYPAEHGSADRTDVLFSYNWERDYRLLIPEIVGIHLESEDNLPQGINWNGRKSKNFGLS